MADEAKPPGRATIRIAMRNETPHRLTLTGSLSGSWDDPGGHKVREIVVTVRELPDSPPGVTPKPPEE